MKLSSIGGLLGVRPKSQNVIHWLGMERLISILVCITSNWYKDFWRKSTKTKP